MIYLRYLFLGEDYFNIWSEIVNKHTIGLIKKSFQSFWINTRVQCVCLMIINTNAPMFEYRFLLSRCTQKRKQKVFEGYSPIVANELMIAKVIMIILFTDK